MSILEATKKARFSRGAWTLIVGGVIVAAYVLIGGSLFRQHLDQGRLSSQIDSAADVLATSDDVRESLEDLDTRLAAANAGLADARTAFPNRIEANSVLETVLALAAERGVQVLTVDAGPPDEEPADGSDLYTVLRFDLQVQGALGGLVSFLESLRGGTAGTLKVASYDFRSGDEGHQLDLELQAYARSGAPPAPQDTGPEDAGAEAAPAEGGNTQ